MRREVLCWTCTEEVAWALEADRAKRRATWIDPATGIVVRRYNLTESKATGVKPERVIGCHLFTEVAQCMNNFMVAQKFLDASEAARPLDESLDFVLTWRMRPTPVKLRLLSHPDIGLQYLLLKRTS